MAIKQLGKYEIIERLGRGGTAEVYKARQASLDRFVAVKLLHPFLADDPEFKDRFEREARNVARLRHPNIVQVYDFEYDSASESFYMVMELIDGQTLKDRLEATAANGDRFSTDEIFRVMRGALDALAYAHRQGMIHRDVKPANLMLDSDGRVVLTDFGIAKIVTGIQFTASGGMVGTPAYMAPEQGLGEAGDERSDLYSMGVILFQMVTGKLPYDADSPLAVILKHLNEPIPSVRNLAPDVPASIEQVILKAMAKEAEDRFQTAEEFLQALLESSEAVKRGTGELISVPPPSKPLRTPSPPSGPMAAPPDTTAIRPMVGSRISGIGGILIILGILTAMGIIGIGSGIIPVGLFRPSATATTTNTATATASSTATQTNTATVTVPPSATFTATPTASDTATPTATATLTITPSLTLTFTQTFTPTATFTPSITPSPTTNITATLQAATNAALVQTSTTVAQTLQVISLTQRAQTTPTPDYTATALQCRPQYLLIQPKAPDKDPIKANTDFERVVILRNTGDCDWLPGTYLKYSTGESFGASIKIVMENQQPVPPNSEARFTFKGQTPKKGGVYTGYWEVRLYPDNKLLDPLLPLSFFAYE